MTAPLDDGDPATNDTALAGAYQSLPLETRIALLNGDNKARADLNRAYAKFATGYGNRQQRRAQARAEKKRARESR